MPGMNVTIVKVGSKVTVPGITAVFVCSKVKTRLVGFTASLNVIEIAPPAETPVAPSAGLVETTVGWMVSA